MGLLINGIDNLSLNRIGETIFGEKKFVLNEEPLSDQKKIYCGMINQTFYLYDHQMDSRNICSLDNNFIFSLFDKFHKNVEIMGFFDNDSDLPAGFSLYRNKNLERRFIRNDQGDLVADVGKKLTFEEEHIKKYFPEFKGESLLDYLNESPNLTNVPSENKPGFVVDDIVDFYLKEFIGQAIFFSDFYVPGISKASRIKKHDFVEENYLSLRK